MVIQNTEMADPRWPPFGNHDVMFYELPSCNIFDTLRVMEAPESAMNRLF